MAQKVLTWSNSQLNSSDAIFMFHVYLPWLFLVLHIRIHFGCERCDTYVYDLYVENNLTR